MYITSKAKIFVIDDLSFEASTADDVYCGPDPSEPRNVNGTGTVDETADVKAWQENGRRVLSTAHHAAPNEHALLTSYQGFGVSRHRAGLVYSPSVSLATRRDGDPRLKGHL